jgi:aryl-alcohol dehydrogenase-like predicted oxidoreductase
VALIKHALTLGVNHFDCARCYGDSLRKLGVALREIPREEVIITGRLCCHSAAQWGFYGEGTPDYSAERVIADVEDQLALLGTDYFDGLLIHDPLQIEPTLAKGGTLEGLLRLKARGLVRYVGYGLRQHDFHLKAIATGEVDLLLCFNDYNLIRQTAADDILPAAAAADIGVLNGWSILRGLLTGVDIEEARAKGRDKNDQDAEAAKEIRQWCLDEGIDLLQLALQFCLREGRIHGNPIGSLNLEQLERNVWAASTPLPDSVWAKYQARFGAV